VFTGSLYSEVEPELAKARADIQVTQDALDKCDAAASRSRAVEKQVYFFVVAVILFFSWHDQCHPKNDLNNRRNKLNEMLKQSIQRMKKKFDELPKKKM
jgi:Skp family chaperone for outer membrane proteins